MSHTEVVTSHSLLGVNEFWDLSEDGSGRGMRGERSKPEGVRKEHCQCRTRTGEVGRRDRDTDGYRDLLH